MDRPQDISASLAALGVDAAAMCKAYRLRSLDPSTWEDAGDEDGTGSRKGSEDPLGIKSAPIMSV